MNGGRLILRSRGQTSRSVGAYRRQGRSIWNFWMKLTPQNSY